MIGFDFEYYKPDTVEEALKICETLNGNGKKVLYYGGGTEFISMARMNNIHADAVIDIKEIPECKAQKIKDNKIIIGAGITLTQIVEADLFPLLSLSARRVADHTIQGKITLGGNICGTIIYKEALLPLLLADSEAVIGSPHNPRIVSVKEIFNKKLNLATDEFIIQIIIDKDYAELPYAHAKRTKQDKIDYPLITSAALKKDNKIRISFSGLYDFPMRSTEIENALNNNYYSLDDRINNAIQGLPGAILGDDLGSAEYRVFVLKNIIKNVFFQLEEWNK